MSGQPNEARIARKKLLAIRRAERRLLHRLEDIEWEETVLLDELGQLDKLTAQGKTPQFALEPGDLLGEGQ